MMINQLRALRVRTGLQLPGARLCVIRLGRGCANQPEETVALPIETSLSSDDGPIRQAHTAASPLHAAALMLLGRCVQPSPPTQ
jgi:hypothetical protein